MNAGQLLCLSDRSAKHSSGYASFTRGLALFLGCFALLNMIGAFRSAAFDANLWWIDLRVLPAWCARTLLFVSAVILVAFALRPLMSGWRRLLTVGAVAALCLAAIINAAKFYSLLGHGKIGSGFPLPLSFLIALGLSSVLVAAVQKPQADANGQKLRVFGYCVACAIFFPLLQMFCFGETDYRRHADAAVVLGARVYADGHPSDALADRVRTACRLYQEGFVRKLIMSGGPGDGPVHETESMKRMAMRLGVQPGDILLDKAGLNTKATARNTQPLFNELHASRMLVVSHFYHLPRIKLAYQHAGMEVFTVPARESYILRQLPYNMLREVVAFWTYYLRGLFVY